MKTSTLCLLGLSLFAFASCTTEEDEPASINKGNAIGFRPAMGTRAAETTNDNLSDITVSAFLNNQPFFNQLAFTKGSDNFFTSDPEYYWPGDDSPITFYAYSPATPGGTLTLTPDTKTLTDFSPASSLADQVDFISSVATGKKSTNEASGLELTFDHRLSQIEIQAKADNEAYVFKVSGIRIGQPVSKGSFDFTSDAWTLGTDKAIYEDTYSTPKTLTADAVSIMGAGGNAMLLPQQLTAWDPTNDASNTSEGAYLSVKLQINTVAGAQVYPFPSNGDCVWAAIPIDTNWEPGKKYIYVLDFSHGGGYVDPHDPIPGDPIFGGPIKFTVDVTNWDSQTPIDVPMTTD